MSSKRRIPGDLPMEKDLLDNLVGFNENLANSPNKPCHSISYLWSTSSLACTCLCFRSSSPSNLAAPTSGRALHSYAFSFIPLLSLVSAASRSSTQTHTDTRSSTFLCLPSGSLLSPQQMPEQSLYPDYANEIAEVHTLDKRQTFYAEQWATSACSGDSGRHLQLRPLPSPQR